MLSITAHASMSVLMDVRLILMIGTSANALTTLEEKTAILVITNAPVHIT
jgi:hypothetical protein